MFYTIYNIFVKMFIDSTETFKHRTLSTNANGKVCMSNNLSPDDSNCNGRLDRRTSRLGRKLPVTHTMSCDTTLNQNEKLRSEFMITNSLKEEFVNIFYLKFGNKFVF